MHVPFKSEFLFPTALHPSCPHALLAFKARCSGGLSAQCQAPALKGRILTLEDCSDLQGAMNIGLACESEFFLQLLFTAALLAPEADFEGFCHYEDPVSGRREKTQALCKDGYIALEQTRSNPPEGSPSPFIPEKAAWILKDKRFIRTDVR